MKNQVGLPEQFADIPFPLRGVDLSTQFQQQHPQTTVIGTNVRAFDPLAMRGRGGSRPGISVYGDPDGLGAKIQLLDFIVDPQNDFLISDTDEGTVDDPSTNNLSMRNPGRKVRRGGSIRQPNRKLPKPTLTITILNQSKYLDESLTLTDPYFDATGLVSGDVITGTGVTPDLSSFTNLAVGTYPLTAVKPVTFADPQSSKHYGKIVFEAGSVVVGYRTGFTARLSLLDNLSPSDTTFVDFDIHFPSGSGTKSLSLTSSIGETYDVDFTLAYNQSTDIYTGTFALTASVGTIAVTGSSGSPMGPHFAATSLSMFKGWLVTRHIAGPVDVTVQASVVWKNWL